MRYGWLYLCVGCLLTVHIARGQDHGRDLTRLSSHYEELEAVYAEEFSSVKGSGYKPYLRLKQFYDQRRMNTGTSSELSRLDLYESTIYRQSLSKSGAPKADWFSVGPTSMETYGGRVISHAFDPMDENKIWVGSASGGLWLTEDAGAHWSSMSDQVPSSGIGAIVIHPSDPQIMLIGTGEGYTNNNISIKSGVGILKSTDGGETWLPTSFEYRLPAGISILKMAWNPDNPEIVWAAATNGLWKSTDTGEHWSLILGDGTNHQNWICDDILIQKNNTDIMYLAIEGRGIFKSTNAGDDFTPLTQGLPLADLNYIRISQCDAQPDVLYTSIIRASNFSLHGVYKTMDGGGKLV